jgi:chromate reductase
MADVIVIVGSLRKESFSRKTANALLKLGPPSLDLEIVEIGQLPLYNADLEGTTPQDWLVFRDRVRRADAVLFVTPEYNRSVTAALKNAVDVGSRPYGQSAWDGKPAAIVSVSQGALGAFGANHHLRQALVFVNMPTLQQPEVYLSRVGDLFDENGQLTNEGTRAFLQKFLEAFDAWIAALAKTTVPAGDGHVPAKTGDVAPARPVP